jgi:Domain of unknown function (DUF4160)
VRSDGESAPEMGNDARERSLVRVWPAPSCGSGRPNATDAIINIENVPTVSRFFGITITMYHDDHGRPHFHARHADGSARIGIDEVEVIDSSLGRRQLRLVLAWA